jgi:hypothetical protein
VNVTLAGVAVTVTTRTVPVPVKLTICGEFDAVSVTERVPVRVPATVGENVTLTVQFAPPFSVAGQLLVWPKSPLDAIEMVVDTLLVFFTITGWLALVVPTAWEENVNFAGATTTVTEEAVPVPVRLTVWGEFDAVSVIVIAPVRVPDTVGVNVTLTVQFASAFSVAGQVLVSPKSPLGAIEIVVFPVPELVTVTDWLALVVPIVCEPNVKLVGEGVTMGAGTWYTKNG